MAVLLLEDGPSSRKKAWRIPKPIRAGGLKPVGEGGPSPAGGVRKNRGLRQWRAHRPPRWVVFWDTEQGNSEGGKKGGARRRAFSRCCFVRTTPPS